MQRTRIYLASLLVAAACVKTGPYAPEKPVQLPDLGAWRLVTVNGGQLPFRIQDAPARVELVADDLRLFSGSFVESGTMRFTQTDGGVSTQTTPEVGTWTGSDTTVMFRSAVLGLAVGVLAGDSLNIASVPGFGLTPRTMIYRRPPVVAAR